MKRITLLFIVMIAGIQFLAAQNQQVQQSQPVQATQQAVQAQPVAKTYAWNETTHDFGMLKQNDPAAVTFTVKNNGTAPLIITAAKSSCGCTVAEYTKEPIKPNESGIVKATYNSARVGPFTKTVTVTFDGIAMPEVLTIKGNVEGQPVAPGTTATPTTPPTPAPTPAEGAAPIKK